MNHEMHQREVAHDIKSVAARLTEASVQLEAYAERIENDPSFMLTLADVYAGPAFFRQVLREVAELNHAASTDTFERTLVAAFAAAQRGSVTA